MCDQVSDAVLVGFDPFIDDLSCVGSKGLTYKDCGVLVRISKRSPDISYVCIGEKASHHFTPKETMCDKDSGGGRWRLYSI